MISYTYKYPRPAVTVDAIIFCRKETNLFVTLIQRANPPFEGKWAFPGGFVDMDESLEAAVERELQEETGLTGIHLEQFYTFGDVHRDPRHRTITVVYIGFADEVLPLLKAGDDAREASWFDVSKLPDLAFDHGDILRQAIVKIGHPVK
jgi:8-oxo-dGTP diphosphatase